MKAFSVVLMAAVLTLMSVGVAFACEQTCWLTAGGVKFDANAGIRVAQGNGIGNGPRDSVGGVAYPSCSPFPSNGGQWNHVYHSLGLHLMGSHIYSVTCWDYDPVAASSPECLADTIQFYGEGVLKPIGSHPPIDGPIPVTFMVNARDLNEPGNESAVNSNQGAGLDTYELTVWTGNADLDSMLKVGPEGPITITGGNFQIHCTSCEAP
jgi:hypothetical protein